MSLWLLAIRLRAGKQRARQSLRRQEPCLPKQSQTECKGLRMPLPTAPTETWAGWKWQLLLTRGHEHACGVLLTSMAAIGCYREVQLQSAATPECCCGVISAAADAASASLATACL